MQAIRNIFHIILVFAILAGGLPHFHPADANRDGEVALADTIISIKLLVNGASGKADFKNNLDNTLNSLYAAAGLKTLIKAERSPAERADLSGINLLFPITQQNFHPFQPVFVYAADMKFIYKAPDIALPTPPPRTGQA